MLHFFRTPAGVQSLAVLLMELQPGADGSQILAADALYQLGRVEEAYRLLLSVGPTSPRAAILARLALLQLHRGFLYDTNQVCRFGAVRSRGTSMINNNDFMVPAIWFLKSYL